MKKYLLLLTISFCVFHHSYSQHGKLDPSFGTKGIVRTNYGTPVDIPAVVRQVLTREDGTFYLISNIDPQTLIIRLLANGTIDSTYGNNGYSQFINMSGYIGFFQRDGKLVVAGSALARYNIDGTLDATFSADGLQETDFGIASIALQSDGKLVVAGGSSSGDFALARYHTNGTLDTTFSEDGKQTVDFASRDDRAFSIAIQSDGKIVAVGVTSWSSDSEHFSDFALVRFHSDGTLDPTFSEDGRQTNDFSSNDYASSVALQNDGKIVVAGTRYVYELDYVFVLARYNTDGTLDPTFSKDGKVMGDSQTNYSWVAMQSDGKIVVAGISANIETSWDFALARYHPDGTLDTTFSKDGKQTTDFGWNYTDLAFSLALQNDGKMVVAGYTYNLDKGFDELALARYLANGTLDPTFSEDGKLAETMYLHSKSATFNTTAVQSDGKIIVAGSVLVRYNINGSLDQTFSDDGIQTPEFFIVAVAIQKDGKIVVIGNGLEQYGLARYNTDGTLDTTFSEDGKHIPEFSPSSLVLQNDGKIVITGNIGYFAVARYKTDGTLDPTFSENGKVATYFRLDSSPTVVALQKDDKIVVAGTTDSRYDFALVRYHTNGTLDTTFSEDGKQTVDFASQDDYASSLAIQNDGKIVVAGNSSGDFTLVRLHSDGTLDATFSEDGKQITDFEANYDYATSVAIQSDGKILVAGSMSINNNSTADFALARYHPDGSLDQSFGQAGKQVSDVSVGRDVIHDLALAANKLYAVGSGQNLGNIGVVARYILYEANQAPTVTLTIPNHIIKYTAPAHIRLLATATDADGRIRRVHFYNGSTLLRTETILPYGFTWQNVPPGTYTLTAKAMDNQGKATTSNAILVIVEANEVAPQLPLARNESLAEATLPGATGLTLAPNPVSTALQIKIPESQTDPPGTVTILSASGQVLKTLQLTDSRSGIALDVSFLASGIYTLTLTSKDKVWYQRFVKL